MFFRILFNTGWNNSTS